MQKTAGKHVPKKGVLVGNILSLGGASISMLVPLSCGWQGFGCWLTAVFPPRRVWWPDGDAAAREPPGGQAQPAAGRQQGLGALHLRGGAPWKVQR